VFGPLRAKWPKAYPNITLEALGLGKAFFEDQDEYDYDYGRRGTLLLTPTF